jgi:type II pantothenate kinase
MSLDRHVALVAAGATMLAGVWWWKRRSRAEAPEPQTPRSRGLRALQDTLALRAAFQSKLGFDIGGTLAKIALTSEPGRDPLEHVTLTHATSYRELGFCTGSTAFHFVALPTHKLEETARSIRERMSWPASDTSVRQIVAAGGGAHRFASAFRTLLQVELLSFPELQAAVHGLGFLAEHGPPHELFTVDAAGGDQCVPWPSPLYPYLLVNLGSGVSGPQAAIGRGS